MRTGLVSWHQRGGMAPEGRVVSGQGTQRAVLGAPGVAPLVAWFWDHRSPRRTACRSTPVRIFESNESVVAQTTLTLALPSECYENWGVKSPSVCVVCANLARVTLRPPPCLLGRDGCRAWASSLSSPWWWSSTRLTPSPPSASAPSVWSVRRGSRMSRPQAVSRLLSGMRVILLKAINNLQLSNTISFSFILLLPPWNGLL